MKASVFVTIIAALASVPTGRCAEATDNAKWPNIAPIKLENQAPLTKEEQTKVDGLINSLTNLDHPYFGLSPTLSGYAFAPIPGTENFEGGLIFINHNIESNADFTELVRLGPMVLPELLNHLDDPSPTKIVIKHDFIMGGMWFDHELPGNPQNTGESKVLDSMPERRSGFPADNLKVYTVPIGDICFAIIGEIVNRPYSPVRYQPTACIVLNSPGHDSRMAGGIRQIWSSPKPAQYLLDSLLTDYTSKDDFPSFQVGAAMRLLFYFPEQTTNLLATRLRQLVVTGDGLKMDKKNGVRTVDLIKAVAWSEEPAIRAELRRIYFSTDDPDILEAAVLASDATSADAFRTRMEQFVMNLPSQDPGPFGTGYKLLVTLGKQFGTEVRPTFEHYMQNASLQRERSMCRVLAEVNGSWSVDLLGPLLQDTREAEGWTYPVNPEQNDPRLPIRICDEAATTISQNFPKLSFKMAGTHDDLDRQIKLMRERIAKHDY